MKTFSYDAIGNLLSKSDVGTYTYPLAGSALPHAVSGGKCGPGALAGGVTSAAGPVINGKGFASLVANAALGGGVAVLGGGKFENGAITGAFGYLVAVSSASELRDGDYARTLH